MSRRKTPNPLTARKADQPLSFIPTQTVFCGNNIGPLQTLPDESVDLIYIDPPFNSNRNYEVFWGETGEVRAFEDRHESTAAYLDFMRPRCKELHRVLRKTGSFYYHCDWHASHYVKVMLDQFFGEDNFQNEIVWKRSFAHSDAKQGSKHFGRLHDVLLFYTGGAKGYTWNQLYTPLGKKYVKSHYRQVDEAGRRFQWTALTGPGGPAKGNPVYEVLGVMGCWRYTEERMLALIEQGRVAIPPKGKVPRYKRYLDESKGIPIQSVWDDIPPVNSQAREARGYPTQKPLALLERIIKASSNLEDVVLDAFCGCGTAIVAAQRLDRRWIGIDISPTSCREMADRLTKECKLTEGADFFVRDLPHTADELREIPWQEFQNWAVIALGGIPNPRKSGDKGVDGRLYAVDAVHAAAQAGGKKAKAASQFSFMDWFPVQVKQKDKAGRQDIDAFETAMHREKRDVGFFVAFDYTADAGREIRRFQKEEGKEIVPKTVKQLLEAQVAQKWA